MEYSIVTNYKINQIFKTKSKYYRVNLGFVSTIEGNGGYRSMNQKDSFAHFYNNAYRTTIYAQGSVGNIRFYTDHYILDDKIAVYLNKEEFIFDIDMKMINEKGADFYLGHLLKIIDTQNQDRIQEKEKHIEIQKQQVGDASKVFSNPGAVNYADLKAYLDKKRAERLGSQL